MTLRRIPIVATLIVLAAVAAMIRLGFWQIERLHEKEAQLALYAANVSKPAIAFPLSGEGTPTLFRKASGFCLQPVSSSVEGAGSLGFRVVVQCRTGAEGPGLTVQIGTSRDPRVTSHWKGGKVSGYVAQAPDFRPLIATLFGPSAPVRLMLVADPPLAGLAPNPAPDLSSIPNNHRAYAVQWFAFAGIALLIYGLALRQRLARPAPKVGQ